MSKQSNETQRTGFGGAIYALRTARRLTQSELANLAGVSLPSIQKIEASPEYKIRWSTFVKLCDALGKTPEDIWAVWRGTPDTKLSVVGLEHEAMKRAEKQARAAGQTVEEWMANRLRQAVGLEEVPPVEVGVVVGGANMRFEAKPGTLLPRKRRGDGGGNGRRNLVSKR